MRNYLTIVLFVQAVLSTHVSGQTFTLTTPLRFLALGDSYTIGESVPASQRWPAQLCDSVFKKGIITDTLEVIATTGWRTDDLINAITGKGLEQKKFNLVSLLIGVNNQYQGTNINQYKKEFPQLLDSAIRFAGGDRSKVIVLSIPDYAYTPFGQQSADPQQISNKIDEYNQLNKHYTDSAGIIYFDITAISRQGIATPSLVAADGLHPSGLQYSLWVKLITDHLKMSTTSLKKEKKSNVGVRIWPNPAYEQINVSSAGDEAFDVRVINILGVTVASAFKVEKEVQVSILPLPSGVYFIEIKKGEEIVTHKLLKNP